MTAKLPIERILCPVDFSEDSKAALESAAVLAQEYGATLFALHVDPVVLSGMGEAPAGPDIRARQALYGRLGQVAQAVRRPGLRVELLLEEGGPVGVILVRARELPADLIVMGTHGRGGMERLLLGSVTTKVLRRAPCPVLCIRRGAELTRGELRPEEGRLSLASPL
jgi:nucleotide-binding universal stress UspA family protein